MKVTRDGVESSSHVPDCNEGRSTVMMGFLNTVNKDSIVFIYCGYILDGHMIIYIYVVCWSGCGQGLERWSEACCSFQSLTVPTCMLSIFVPEVQYGGCGQWSSAVKGAKGGCWWVSINTIFVKFTFEANKSVSYIWNLIVYSISDIILTYFYDKKIFTEKNSVIKRARFENLNIKCFREYLLV
jgi:hypothetical protein